MSSSKPGCSGLVVPADPARAAEIRELAGQAAAWATRARGAGTLHAYRSAWTRYTAWCERLGFPPLTGKAEIIVLYLVKAAERLTVRVHLAAIATAHRLAGVPVDLKHPRIALVLDGLARGQADRPMPPSYSMPSHDPCSACLPASLVERKYPSGVGHSREEGVV